ncbi:MAG: hypothetical protein UW72_C0003G0018 [Parcubacteria group bacterium GW2011_GWF2_44_7]|nr:MAG: hypothetical protein UW72_C0003G0018 [Parcubacteria group bacterium GW2011_GWF2_44_7]
MSKLKLFIFIIILLFVVFFSASVKAQDFNFTKTFGSSWAYVDKPNQYDSSQSAMIDDDGRWLVWNCGGGDINNGVGGDTIFFDAFDANGQHIPGLENILALRHSGLDSHQDGLHACAPSVIKHSYPSIEGGHEMYKLYYECAPKLYDNISGWGPRGGFNSICHAVSDDGIIWRKYNKDIWNTQFTYGNQYTAPTPVIEINQKIKDNCQLTFDGFKYYAYFYDGTPKAGCSDFSANYGPGHPSAVVINNEIWLFYYDSQGDASQIGLFLAKSWDGFNFGTPVKTNYPSPLNVKYLSMPIGNHQGVFIGTFPNKKYNYFAYSYDGINWVYSHDADSSKYRIGIARNELCTVSPEILANKYGIFYSPIVNIFSAEGYYGHEDSDNWNLKDSLGNYLCYDQREDPPWEGGIGRGSTQAMYFIQGEFTWFDDIYTLPYFYGTITGSDCVMANGQSSCSTNISWLTQNVTSGYVQKRGIGVFSSSLNGTQAAIVNSIGDCFDLYQAGAKGDTLLDSVCVKGVTSADTTPPAAPSGVNIN